MNLIPNRIGKSVEYKQGHYYLTCTDWGDGHAEIEIHRCTPELLFHSCDIKDAVRAKDVFTGLVEGEKKSRIILTENGVKPIGSFQDLIENEGRKLTI